LAGNEWMMFFVGEEGTRVDKRIVVPVRWVGGESDVLRGYDRSTTSFRGMVRTGPRLAKIAQEIFSWIPADHQM
jgi:hypothetical protein